MADVKVDIAAEHPDYNSMKAVWQKMRDTDQGAAAIRAGKERYLPKPDGMTFEAYGAYLRRAEYPGAVKRARVATVGLMFGRDPEVTVPPQAEQWRTDADLSDTPLDQFVAGVAREVVLIGRAVIIVDWSSKANRPRFARYDAEDLINWQTDSQDGDERLVRAVLRERFLQAQEDGSHKPRTRFREYFIDASGFAVVRTWEQVGESELVNPAQPKFMAGEPVVLTRRGEPLTELPAVILGPSSVGAEVEQPLLLELADSSVEFFQVSADYRHTLHYLGCPTTVVAGRFSGGGGGDEVITRGPAVIWMLEQGSTASQIGAKSDDVAPLSDYLKAKREEMISLGVALLDTIQRPGETATAALIRAAGHNASLRDVAGTVEQAATTALRRAVWWSSAEKALPEDVSYKIDKDFMAPLGVSPQEWSAWTAAYAAGTMSFETLYSLLQRRGVAREGVSAAEEKKAIDDTPVGYGSAPNAVEKEVQ